MAQGFRAKSPRIHQHTTALKKHLHWSAPLQGRSEIMSATGVARSDEHHHARDTARSRAEHLLWAMASPREGQKPALYRGPLPIRRSLDARIPTLQPARSSKSQQNARRRVYSFSSDEKKTRSGAGLRLRREDAA